MKTVLVWVTLLALAMPALADIHPRVSGVFGTSVVHHGGGCRKDSPPGKCCHAGSQPYHCH